MELCNRGYNSNLKNLLVKHQNSSVYCHRWRLLSGVSLICFYGIILEIFLAELYGWLTPDERAFARLYPWNHEVAIFLGRQGGGGTFRDVNIFFSRFKVLVSSIDSKKRGVAVSGALQQRL